MSEPTTKPFLWYFQILSMDGKVLVDIPFNVATDFEFYLTDQHSIKPPFRIRFGDARKQEQ